MLVPIPFNFWELLEAQWGKKKISHLFCVWCLFYTYLLCITWLYAPSKHSLEKPHGHWKDRCHDGLTSAAIFTTVLDGEQVTNRAQKQGE
jgi:hypothetical protein